MTVPESICTRDNLQWTQTAVTEKHVYRFYVIAKNALGKSGASPILAVLAAEVPIWNAKTDAGTANNQWTDHNGGSPITGYKLYQFKGIAKNTVADPYPVKLETQ